MSHVFAVTAARATAKGVVAEILAIFESQADANAYARGYFESQPHATVSVHRIPFHPFIIKP